MSNIVLIHGGAHGPWCWDKVVPYLRSDPRLKDIVAVDLQRPATGQEPVQLEAMTTDDYITEVVREIESRDLYDVILVGHSMAGIVIAPAVFRIPGRIKRVIYLATSNPVVGQSIADLMQHPLSPLSRRVDRQEMFCSDLDEETKQWLLSNLRAEPMKPFTEPVTHTLLPRGIPSTYVLLERDKALLPEFQLEQAKNAGVDEVVRFDSGHSAFASRPRDLARLILSYV